jgi:hypothetical protein
VSKRLAPDSKRHSSPQLKAEFNLEESCSGQRVKQQNKKSERKTMTIKELTNTNGAPVEARPARSNDRRPFLMRPGASLLVVAALLATAIIAFATELKHVRGRAAGTVSVAPSENDASLFIIHFSGTGTLTHIGRFEFVLDSLATVDSEGNPSAVPGSSTGTITTPNGDQIFFTLGWTVDRDGDQIDGTGPVTVQAGTGKFAQITLSGEFITLADLGTGQMSTTFTGTLATK